MKLFVLVIFSLINLLHASSSHCKCPRMDIKTHTTQNGMGKSSYTDFYMNRIFVPLWMKGMLNLNKPILIAGAGYGAGASELLSLGANQLYLNDLDISNLVCAKGFIKKSHSSAHVEYLPGNISSPELMSKIPDNSLGLVYAKNLIQFQNAIEIVDLIKGSKRKLQSNGQLVIVFENAGLEQQMELIEQIRNDFKMAQKSSGQITLDDVTKQHYQAVTACSVKDYEDTPKDIRGVGFPCIYHFKKMMFNSLTPKTVESLLKTHGFRVIDSQRPRKDTFIISAIKK